MIYLTLQVLLHICSPLNIICYLLQLVTGTPVVPGTLVSSIGEAGGVHGKTLPVAARHRAAKASGL